MCEEVGKEEASRHTNTIGAGENFDILECHEVRDNET